MPQQAWKLPWHIRVQVIFAISQNLIPFLLKLLTVKTKKLIEIKVSLKV